MADSTVLPLVAVFALRLAAMAAADAAFPALQWAPGLATPLTALPRLRECAAVPLSPVCLASPLLVAAFRVAGSRLAWSVVLAAADAVATVSIMSLCATPAQRRRVALVALLSPWAALAAGARSAGALGGALAAGALAAAHRGAGGAAAAAWALAAALDAHHLALAAPIVGLLARRGGRAGVEWARLGAVLLAAMAGAEMLAPGLALRPWRAAWGGGDLEPNMGLHWYFGATMFAEFRPFFRAVFAGHSALVAAALSVRLRRDAVPLAALLLGAGAAFKAYPAAGDAQLALMVLAATPVLDRQVLHGPALVGAGVTYVLGGVSYSMWLGRGSGNANFVFFANNVAWAAVQIVYMLEALYAWLALEEAKEMKTQ